MLTATDMDNILLVIVIACGFALVVCIVGIIVCCGRIQKICRKYKDNE